MHQIRVLILVSSRFFCVWAGSLLVGELLELYCERCIPWQIYVVNSSMVQNVMRTATADSPLTM